MFRKKFLKKKTWFVCDSTPVVEYSPQTISEQDDNGVIVQRVAFVPIDFTSKEVVKSLPDAKDYTLENLLAAGVPLQELAVGSLLNPTDFATNGSIAERIADSLSNSKNE